MNAEALPYTLLLIMAELSIGSLWITLASDLRGGVTRGFVMTMALCVAVAAGLAYWTAGAIDLRGDIDGYRIDQGPFDGRVLEFFRLAEARYHGALLTVLVAGRGKHWSAP